MVIIGGSGSGKTNSLFNLINQQPDTDKIHLYDNKKFNRIVTELFIRGRKLNISLAFITQSYSAVPMNIRLNSTHYFIMIIRNQLELQKIAPHSSSDIDFKDLMNLYMKCTAKPYSFLSIDATFASDNPLRFKKNLVERI